MGVKEKYIIDAACQLCVLKNCGINVKKSFVVLLADAVEPTTSFSEKCSGCDYWKFCSRNIQAPSPFDVYHLRFAEKWMRKD